MSTTYYIDADHNYRMSDSDEDQGQKFDSGKPRPDLVSGPFVLLLGAVLEFGLHKYGEHNWRKGVSASRQLAAALRHLLARLSGEVNDPESRLPHLAHAAVDIMMAWEQVEHFGEERSDFDRIEVLRKTRETIATAAALQNKGVSNGQT